MSTILRVLKKLEKPGELFRYGSIQRREQYSRLSKIFRRRTTNARALSQFSLDKSCSLRIQDDLGFLKLGLGQCTTGLHSLLKEAHKDIETHCSKENTNQNKTYLQNVAVNRKMDLAHPYLKFALDPKLITIISHYLGIIPVLSDIRIWHSPNKDPHIAGSQLFHLDWADTRQVKVFVFLDETNSENGPTNFLPADISRKICNSIGYKLFGPGTRIEDETILKYVGLDQIEQATGERGELLLVDTSRCLHFGSREAKKKRNLIMFQYVSPFSFLYSWNFQKGARFSNLINHGVDPLTRKVLGEA